ncbi:MAG: hypothetical protein JSW40_07160 [Candidatus Omnitrophota bacterium]|nr:MAG: hypothetical protein JSW40_07160 [Candidatus Omnitrophota bacterium]
MSYARNLMKSKQSYKTNIVFPVELLNGMIGETVDIDIDESNICLNLKRIPPQKFQLHINLITHGILKISVISKWRKRIKGSYHIGCKFYSLNRAAKKRLKGALLQFYSLDRELIDTVRELRWLLYLIKNKFNEFDKKEPTEAKQIKFILSNRKWIFEILDKKFNKIWRITKKIPKTLYNLHKLYVYHMTEYFLGRGIEINTHIYKKPLGYPGDFITMNYILDYHRKKYLGKSTYEKLINHYTCKIPISCSNVARKNFFKKKILDTFKKRQVARITSVGSGSVRELIELAREGKITTPVIFKWFDFEKKALDYVKSQLRRIGKRKKRLLRIEYICKNVLSFINTDFLNREIGKQDFIYSSGFFDYLPEGVARRLVNILYGLIDDGGKLIICNASSQNSGHRAYYEMAGDWIFHHRSKKQLLDWVKDCKKSSKVRFEDPCPDKNYLFLSIARNK